MDWEVLASGDLEAIFSRGFISALQGRELIDKKVIKVAIFVGGKGSRQTGPFYAAYDAVKAKIRKRYPGISIVDVKIINDEIHGTHDWGPEDLTNAILGCDIHFILCHPHQGNVARSQARRPGAWSVKNIYAQVSMWKYQLGFMNGKYIICPVFTQDKRRYIEAAKDICIPSLFLDLPNPAEGLKAADRELLKEFFDRHAADYNSKFVVKLPFVTHRIPKYPVGLAEIDTAIMQYSRNKEVFNFIPYVIIQPR